MIRRLASAAVVAAALLPLGAAATAPATTVVDLGATRAYVRPDATMPLAGVELFVRAGLDRQTPSQNGLAALAAEAVLRTPVDGVPLADAVAAAGGSVTYAVSAQYARFYVEAQPEALGTIAPLVGRALANPSTDPAVLDGARAALGRRIADDESDPRLVGIAMLRGAYYRDGAGMPAMGTPATLAGFGPADLRGFYAKWYVRGDAFVTAVGSTGPASDAAGRTIAASLPDGTAPAATLAIRGYGAQPKRIVTRRDIGVSYVVLGFAAPPLGDRDFAAALVMRALLSDVFNVSSATVPPPLRAVGTAYGYDVAPAQLTLWISGARIDPTVGLAAVDTVLKGAAAKPLGAAAVAHFKETARGQWALETLSLDERAWSIGNAVAHGLAADAPDAVVDAIANVTPADLQRVAKRYFQRFDVALILPRQGSGG